MEIELTCMQCNFDKTKQQNRKYSFDNNISVHMNDEGAYIAECPEGHKNKVIIQNPKFEILFDLAIIAYIDGYNREAISNLTSAYERFLQFFIEIILLNKKIKPENFDKTWKKMKNQSERQLGGFMVLWLAEFDELPPMLHQNRVSFRNNVIHKGYIPSNEETLDYFRAIYDLLFPMIGTLKEKYDSSIQEHTMFRLMKLNNKYKDVECPSTTMSLGSKLGLYIALSEYKKKEIEELIEQTKKTSSLFYKKFRVQEHQNNRYQILEAIYGKYV